jgi:uncharacterized short protein YbdD (DUF466 family)
MPRRLAGGLRALVAVLHDVLRGAAGADAYGHYLAHLSRHHPDCRPLSRGDFFRKELAARWEGVRRCC